MVAKPKTRGQDVTFSPRPSNAFVCSRIGGGTRAVIIAKEAFMSMMCRMSDQCCAKKGMCIHEILMLVIVAAIAVAGHFMFRWY